MTQPDPTADAVARMQRDGVVDDRAARLLAAAREAAMHVGARADRTGQLARVADLNGCVTATGEPDAERLREAMTRALAEVPEWRRDDAPPAAPSSSTTPAAPSSTSTPATGDDVRTAVDRAVVQMATALGRRPQLARPQGGDAA